MGQAWSTLVTPLVLNGTRVRLRALSATEHAVVWRGLLAEPEVARWLGDGGPPASRLTLAIERREDGALIGGVALCDLTEDGAAELVIAIADPLARGRGLGREAIALLVGHATEGLGLREVYLRVQADNRRAVRCYLACGFVKEGVILRRRGETLEAPVVLMSRRSAPAGPGTAKARPESRENGQRRARTDRPCVPKGADAPTP